MRKRVSAPFSKSANPLGKAASGPRAERMRTLRQYRRYDRRLACPRGSFIVHGAFWFAGLCFAQPQAFLEKDGVLSIEAENYDNKSSSTYALYTQDGHTVAAFSTRALIWTLPFCIVGIARFTQLALWRPSRHSPTDAILRDWPFMLNLMAWGVVVLYIIYYG